MPVATADTLPGALDALLRQLLPQPVSCRSIALVLGERPASWGAWLQTNQLPPEATVDHWLRELSRNQIAAMRIERIGRKEFRVTTIDGVQSERLDIADTERVPETYNPGDMELLGKGHSRIVYRYDEETVVKIPLSEAGLRANRAEAQMYADAVTRAHRLGHGPESINLARCELGTMNGTPALFMEYVRKSRRNHGKHKKHLRHVDRGQLGYTADGRLVRFDYGG